MITAEQRKIVEDSINKADFIRFIKTGTPNVGPPAIAITYKIKAENHFPKWMEILNKCFKPDELSLRCEIKGNSIKLCFIDSYGKTVSETNYIGFYLEQLAELVTYRHDRLAVLYAILAPKNKFTIPYMPNNKSPLHIIVKGLEIK